MKHREKAHGWKGANRGYRGVQRGGRGSPQFATPVRQNNQNSQNEPGMSFVINKPCRAGSGPDLGATGSREPDRGRFELTACPSSSGRKPTVGKAPTVATEAFKEEQGVSLFASGMSFGINQIASRGGGRRRLSIEKQR